MGATAGPGSRATGKDALGFAAGQVVQEFGYDADDDYPALAVKLLCEVSGQKMILAESSEERTKQLNLLLPSQRSDFDGLFDAIVPEESLLSSNTLTTFAGQATKIIGPGLSANCPTFMPGQLCMPNMASIGNFWNRPSLIISRAPPPPSSAGWNTR